MDASSFGLLSRSSCAVLLPALLWSSAAPGFSLFPDDPVSSGGSIDVPATLYRAAVPAAGIDR